MRNLAEQKRVFSATMFSYLIAFIWVILFFGFFLFNLFPVAGVLGINLLPYTSEAAGVYKKGDLVLYTAKMPEAPEGKLFSYYTEATNEKGKTVKIKHTMLFAGSYEQEETAEVDGETVTLTKKIYLVQQTADGAISYLHEDTVFEEGWAAFRIPFIGYAAMYLNYNIYVSVFSLIAITLAMLLPTAVFVIRRAAFATDLGFRQLVCILPPGFVFFALAYRKKYNVLATPFAEGIDARDLSKENYFIITELRHFFKKGKFQFVKGHDCYKVYIPSTSRRKLFATIMQVNKHIQVLIHTDLKRPDGRIDRSNYINIYNAVELPDIKKEIVRLYREYFKPKTENTMY